MTQTPAPEEQTAISSLFPCEYPKNATAVEKIRIAFDRDIPPALIKTTQKQGGHYDYIKWHTVCAMLNASGLEWSSDIRAAEPVIEREGMFGWRVVGSLTIEGIARSNVAYAPMKRDKQGIPLQVDPGIKHAGSDLLKRCAAQFGRLLGLGLYTDDEDLALIDDHYNKAKTPAAEAARNAPKEDAAEPTNDPTEVLTQDAPPEKPERTEVPLFTTALATRIDTEKEDRLKGLLDYCATCLGNNFKIALARLPKGSAFIGITDASPIVAAAHRFLSEFGTTEDVRHVAKNFGVLLLEEADWKAAGTKAMRQQLTAFLKDLETYHQPPQKSEAAD